MDLVTQSLLQPCNSLLKQGDSVTSQKTGREGCFLLQPTQVVPIQLTLLPVMGSDCVSVLAGEPPLGECRGASS